MYIKSVKLTNFRNYDSLELNVSPGVNVIYGKNGQGKTNILEAMFLCTVGKSFRTAKESEMIKDGADKYEVELEIEDNLARFLKVEYDRKKSKIVRIDGSCISKIRFLMGKFLGVIFSPEDIDLVSEGPQNRRKFLNMALCQLSSDYYYALTMYNKTLKEKNLYLSSIGAKDDMMISVYNEALAEHGARIIFDRAVYIKRLDILAKTHHSEIAGPDGELLEFKYETVKDLLSGINISVNSEMKYAGTYENDALMMIKSALLKVFMSPALIEREKSRGISLEGPHRDDFDIFLGGKNLKIYGSQGQKRTAVISIKLAELDIIKSITGRIPVLFLDDVMSELDEKRRSTLTTCIKGVQTFITCTEKETVGRFNALNGVNFIDSEIIR